MNFLFLTWKDKKHPLAGGAEMINEELAKRLVQNGHKVIFLVAGFKGSEQEEFINGYTIIRLGNKWTVYWRAYKYYKNNLQNWADLIIDEMNTIPFFAKYYPRFSLPQKKPVPDLVAEGAGADIGVKYPFSEKNNAGIISRIKSPLYRKESAEAVANILFVHQLCREIWFYEMFFPLNILGYLLEPIYLRLLNDRKVITVSESAKFDLLKYGFREENIQIISEGIELEPIVCHSRPSLCHSREGGNLFSLKYKVPTILCFGSVRAMKRTDHIIKAFEIAKDKMPDLKLIIAGDYDNKFGRKVYKMAEKSRHSESIEFLGKASYDKKKELLQKSHVLCSASVKEGWGLTITEANSQGTSAVVYDVDGLRDSVRHNETGIVCEKNTPQNMAENIISLLEDKEKYEKLRFNAWQWSKEINFDKSYNEFIKFIKSLSA
jgi:glycosyltransferase involved in cell wall biosynthesis